MTYIPGKHTDTTMTQLLHADSDYDCLAVITFLLGCDIEFACAPDPDGGYVVGVQSEDKDAFDRIIELVGLAGDLKRERAS